MDNYSIADQFSMLSKLMDIHSDNSFRAKSYSIAAFNIEKLPVQLADIEQEKIFTLKGIGDSVGKKIIEILDKGHLGALQEYVDKTPPGILEMMHIKGLGPKKIATIWKEMEIESLGELLYACTENRLARLKGFGEKTQKNVQDAINFYMKSKGSHLYAEVEAYAWQLNDTLVKKFSDGNIQITGAFRMQCEVIDELEWVTLVSPQELKDFFSSNGYELEEELEHTLDFRGPEKILVRIYPVPRTFYFQKLFQTSASPEFLEIWYGQDEPKNEVFRDEEEIFELAGIHYIPPFMREKALLIEKASKMDLPVPIQEQDIRGIIHSHSTWSDGSHTLEVMAEACIKKGYEYLVISDHSKSAFYANGLSEERIMEQHTQIDELNKKLAPFRIFKSIECDILNDGSLDYSDEILSGFDLVIASIHSNIKMTEEKAMSRLLRAIENPYTNILGHMTARLLLSRPGYPVDHDQIIEACKKHRVVIELNANPRRLDMDWRFIDVAIEQGVMMSIDPDAHSIEEFDVCRYGVLIAQKAGMEKKHNLSSYGLKEFTEFINAK